MSMRTINFHAVLSDECGGEFGADIVATDREAAYDELNEQFPESTVVQLESPEDTQKREHDTYARLGRMMDDDWMDDGEYD
jgi:hypothetical protein